MPCKPLLYSPVSKPKIFYSRLNFASACCFLSLLFLLSACEEEEAIEPENGILIDDKALVAELSEEIPRLMTEAKIPGLSIAIVKDGKIIWSQGFGVTDLSSPSPVTNETIFESASLSKPVFALAYLQFLEEEGLDLDEPVANSFSYDRFSDDERKAEVTPRMILSHRTGLPNWDREGDLDFDRNPGGRYGYSGEGFVYLQRFVEAHTGLWLHDFAAKRIFGPLGMKRSGFVWQDGFETSFAEGHWASGEVRPSPRYEEANSAYSLMTTSTDFGKFLAFMMAGGNLTEKTLSEMLAVQTRMTGSETRTAHPEEIWGKIFWGLSWGIQKTDDRTIYWHWGDNETYRNFTAFDLDRKIGFVYFTNSENGLAIANEIAQPIVGDMHWTITWLGYGINPLMDGS